MANVFPCPNPACSYQFDAETLPAAAMVTCPVCHTRFPYRANAQAAAAQQGAADDSWYSPPSGAGNERTNRLLTPRNVPKANKTQTALMVAGFALVGVTLLLVIMFSMRKSWFGNREQGETYIDQNFNFRFKRFESRWREDTSLRQNTFNGFLQKMKDDDAWIGMRCVYLGGGNGIRGPRDGELEAQIDLVLRQTKFTGIQKESVPATISKQPAEGYRFTANLNDLAVWGEIHATSFKGIGYVMVIWASADSWGSVQEELIALRNSFEFAGIRDKWKEAPSASQVHFVDGGDYQIEDLTIGLWERAVPETVPIDDDGKKKAPLKRGTYVGDPTDEDENCTMRLQCIFPVDFGKNLQNRSIPVTHAMTLVLPNMSATVDDIRAYLQASLEKKNGSKYTFEPLEKQPFDTAMPAEVKAFRVTNAIDKTHKYYYAIKVMKINNHTVAAVGWCRENKSDLMGPYVVNLVKTLKPR